MIKEMDNGKKSHIVFAFIVLIVLLIGSSVSAGEIKTSISDYDSLYLGDFAKEPRPFIGNFQFENVPIPATPTKVHFTLEVINKGFYSEKNWVINLNCYPTTLLLSDSTFNWPGPHKIGDKFQGEFEFMPYMAGFGGISIYLGGYLELRNSGIAFGYCFDEDGNLSLLDKCEMFPGFSQKQNCLKYGFRNIFYNQDSIVFMTPKIGKSDQPFEYTAVIKPIPSIGNRSTIFYTLKANKDISEIDKTILRLSNVDYIDASTIDKAPLRRGEALSFSIDFTPELRKGFNSISLYQGCKLQNTTGPLTTNPGTSSGLNIDFSMLFNVDGTLKYCGTMGLEMPKEMISSKAYQERPARDFSTYQF